MQLSVFALYFNVNILFEGERGISMRLQKSRTSGSIIMIGIIDYDAGNIKSVEKALQYLGTGNCSFRDPQVLLKADKVILPGVGSFGDAMENLNKYGLVPVIHEMVKKELRFLESVLDCSFFLRAAMRLREWKDLES